MKTTKELQDMMRGMHARCILYSKANHNMAKVVKALEKAILDPKGVAPKKREAKPQVQKHPLYITTTADEVLVSGIKTAGIHFWKVTLTLDSINGVDSGRVYSSGKNEGKTKFKSTFDRKEGFNRLPLEKKDEIIKFFQDEGIIIEIDGKAIAKVA